MIQKLNIFKKIIKTVYLNPNKYPPPKTLALINLTLNLKMIGSNVIYVMKQSYQVKCIKSQIMVKKRFVKNALKDLKKA